MVIMSWQRQADIRSRHNKQILMNLILSPVQSITSNQEVKYYISQKLSNGLLKQMVSPVSAIKTKMKQHPIPLGVQ